MFLRFHVTLHGSHCVFEALLLNQQSQMMDFENYMTEHYIYVFLVYKMDNRTKIHLSHYVCSRGQGQQNHRAPTN